LCKSEGYYDEPQLDGILIRLRLPVQIYSLEYFSPLV